MATVKLISLLVLSRVHRKQQDAWIKSFKVANSPNLTYCIL